MRTNRVARTARALGLAVLGTAMVGCERVVAVDVHEGPTRLVVEARIERVQGRVNGDQSIRLTTTSPYFSNGAPPPARGAIVRVTDETGAAVTFVESAASPGTYTTSALVGVVGRRYTLAIDYGGQHYESTERLNAVPRIDSLYFAPPEFGADGPPDGLRATIDLRDPRGVQNWYLWDQYVDGVRLVGPDSTLWMRVTESDEGLDGYRIARFQPYDGYVIKPGSTVTIRQIALSEAAYRYYFALTEQTSNDGSPFAVPPSSVRGNIVNRTDPSRFALGYFVASEVAEARATLAR